MSYVNLLRNVSYYDSYDIDSFIGQWNDYCRWDDEEYWLLENDLILISLEYQETHTISHKILIAIMKIVETMMIPKWEDFSIEDDAVDIFDRFERFKYIISNLFIGIEIIEDNFFYRKPLKIRVYLNSEQVNEQSGFKVGTEGVNVQVDGHTQLNGAVIESQATADKNQFTTKTFASSDIRNHSEVKTESVSVSSGGMSAMTTAMSLLGNRSESDSSTTKSAVSANINLNVENGEIPTALSRDTQNANEKVGKQDLQKIRAQQEMARVIGEIADNAVKISGHKELEAIEQANLELGKIKQQAKEQGLTEEQLQKSDRFKEAQEKVNQAQKTYDDNYGIGSNHYRITKAVTAALQGLANHSPKQAAALASPYLNQKIHEATKNADGTTDKATNLAAHAVLSAIEAQITGNNALAGAAAGVAAEGTAMLIAEKLYEKPIDKLTDSEKQNIVFLSELAGGLAGGITGNSTADVVAGAETGKRAVENNFLSRIEWERLAYLSKKKVLTYEEALEIEILRSKDRNSEFLLDKYQKQQRGGEPLTSKEQEQLFKWIEEYGSIPEQMMRINQPAFSAELRPDYSEMFNRANKILNHAERYETKQSESLKTGFETTANIYSGSALTKLGVETLPKLGAAGKYVANAAEKYPLLTDITTTAIVNTGYQLSQDRAYDPYSLLQSELSTVLTRNKSLGQQLSINLGINTLAVENDSDYGWETLGSLSGTLGANIATKVNIGRYYGNTLLKPIISGTAGEYLGDTNRIKSTLDNFKENHLIKDKE